jgi:hypothetical protein
VAAGHAWLIDDEPSLRQRGLTGVTFGLLQTVALARYGTELDWSSASAIAYIAVLVALTVVSGWALLPGRTPAPAPRPDASATRHDVDGLRLPREPIGTSRSNA